MSTNCIGQIGLVHCCFMSTETMDLEIPRSMRLYGLYRTDRTSSLLLYVYELHRTDRTSSLLLYVYELHRTDRTSSMLPYVHRDRTDCLEQIGLVHC